MPACALQEVEVHIEGKFQGRDVGFLLGGALPVYESVAEVYEICDLLLAGGRFLAGEGVQQGDEELRLKEIVFLIDAIDEPVVLKDIEEEIALLVLEVGLPSDLDDAPAALVVNDEAGVLLLDVLGQL